MPGMRCSVSTCNNSMHKTRNDPLLKHVMYHGFPKDKEIQKQWTLFCNRDSKWKPDQGHVCSEHFKPEDYQRDLQAELLKLPPKRRLKKMAIPSLQSKNKKMISVNKQIFKQSGRTESIGTRRKGSANAKSVSKSKSSSTQKSSSVKTQEQCEADQSPEEFIVEYLEETEHWLSQEIVTAPERNPTQLLRPSKLDDKKCQSCEKLKQENDTLKEKCDAVLKDRYDLDLKLQEYHKTVQLHEAKLKELAHELSTLKEKHSKEHMIVESRCDGGMYEVFVVMNHEGNKSLR